MKRPLPSIPLLLSLAACGSAPTTGPSVALDDHPVVIIRDPQRDVGENAAIRAYEAFLSSAPAMDPRRPAVERRIAGLHLLAAEAAALQAGGEREARRHYEAAAALYERLLPSSSPARRDALLYGLAEAYEGLVRHDDKRRVLERLIADHPTSPYRAEAGFRLAEDAFRRGELSTAADGYLAVVTGAGDAPFRLQARYKLAWTRLRQGEYEAAAKGFLSLLDTLDRASPSVGARIAVDAPMRDDGIRGLALSLRRLGGVDGLERLLAGRRDDDGTARLYEALGEQQLAHGEQDAALETWHRYAEAHAGELAAARLWLRIIRLESSLGRRTEAERSRRRFAAAFGPDSPFWKRHEPRTMPGIARPLARLYRELGSQAHARAQESGADEDYREAARWYRDYLALFGDEADAAEIRYLLAELYEASGQIDEAIEAYERFAYRYPGDRRAAEAAYVALQLTDPAESTQTPFMRRLTRFVNTFGGHPRAPLLLARTAIALHEAGQTATALDLAGRVLAWRPPAPAKARRAALLVQARQAYADEDLATAERLYERLLDLGGMTQPERAALVEDLARIAYRRGRRALEAGRPLEAARAFSRILAKTPKSRLAATAEFDAATAYMQAGHWGEAIELLDRFLEEHPSHPLAARIPAKLVKALLESGQPLRAAAVLEQIAEGGDEDGATRREALLKAAELYHEHGDADRAATLYRRYASRHPSPLETAQRIRRRLADMARDTGREAEYRHWLTALVDAADGQPLPRPLAAQAALELAAIEDAAYRAIRLDLPLKPSLASKQARFEAVLTAYRRAAGLGDAETTTAATYHLAEAYAHFAHALMASERPAGLDEIEREDYDVLLEEQAEPFEARAIELHEGNLRRLRQGVYGPWIAASIDALATIFPARYARPEQGEPYLDDR